MIPIQIGTRHYKNRSLPVSVQNLINLYVETQTQDARSQLVAHRTPGTGKYMAIGSGPIRGHKVMDNVLYVVTGTELYSVTTAGASALIGTIVGTDLVGMEVNDRDLKQLMITTGTTGYIYSRTDGLEAITDEDFVNARAVTYQDGYFITDIKETGKWQISSVLNGKTYDSTERGASNVRPDIVLRCISNHQQVWVFGADTIEPYYNAANLDFPFVRISEATNDELGLGAIWSLCEFDNTIVWVGSDREVYMAEGYNAVVISDPTVSLALQNTNMEKIDAFVYTEEGHKFYQLNTEEATYVYDAREKSWHQRSWYNKHTGKHERHRARTYSYFNGQHIVGDYENNLLYTMDKDITTDNADYIKWEMVFPPIHNNNRWFGIKGLYVDIETGTQDVSADEQVNLHLSRDANTWKDHGGKSIGKTGEYYHRVQFNRLRGTRKQQFFKLSGTTNAKFSIYGAGLVSPNQ